MDLFIKENIIEKRGCGEDFSYILNDNSNFSPTEYKVLQNQSEKYFIKCMKLLYNGKIELYYSTNGYKKFKTVIEKMNIEGIRSFVESLFKSIIDIKNNGFLLYYNIDLSSEKIYIDEKDYKVKFIYLPIMFERCDNKNTEEMNCREKLIKIIAELVPVLFNGTRAITEKLLDETISLEEIYTQVLSGELQICKLGHEDMREDFKGTVMRLEAINVEVKIGVNIDKDVFILGRNTFIASGNTFFNNKMIGRIHCKIIRRGSSFMVEDLKSINGTYINGLQLESNQLYSLQSGDILKLANTEFSVVIK